MIPFSHDKRIPSTFGDTELICYCFQYTKKDIEDDYRINGYSQILKRIEQEKKSDICNCPEKNPRGR